MTTLSTNWEQSLVMLAGEARLPQTASGSIATVDRQVIDRAYDYCAQLTSYHSRSFYLATALLPRDKRRAMRALYAFCRVSDNIVDNPKGDPRIAFERWRLTAMSNQPPYNDPVCLAWTETRTRYRIPTRFAEQLLDGVARDMEKVRYESFDDLAGYAYGVASTVGLMSQHIIGFSDPAATPYAIKLGVALQVTNILRDVGEDWRHGRLYLPTSELAAYGLAESDIAAGIVDGRWRAFMRFQIGRNLRLYREAWPGIGLLHPDGHLAVSAAAEFYRAILADIEANDYDVFSRRAHVSGREKLSMLPGIWWRSRQLRPAEWENTIDPAGGILLAG